MTADLEVPCHMELSKGARMSFLPTFFIAGDHKTVRQSHTFLSSHLGCHTLSLLQYFIGFIGQLYSVKEGTA
jgi:hypothetical protein